MAYEAVSDLLAESASVAAFPDGSVDTYSRVCGADGAQLSEAELADRLTGARARSFRLDREAVEPGGQAVNAARQAHALGDDVRLYGCLDDETLSFPFPTRSFGEPTRVDIHQYADGDLIYADVSDAVREWTHERLPAIPERDAYFCGNLATVEAMSEALRALGGELDGGVFVFDPGDVTDAPPERLRECTDALGALDGVEVALSLNGRELEAFAEAGDVASTPAALRESIGVAAVVRHETESADAAARGGTVRVENVDVGAPARRTGGGDRFGAGLAHGLAVGDGIRPALALGNLCASYYVATGETGDDEALSSIADDIGRV